MPRKCGTSSVFCAETCNIGKNVFTSGLISAFASIVEAVGGVSFFFIQLRKFSLNDEQQQYEPVRQICRYNSRKSRYVDIIAEVEQCSHCSPESETLRTRCDLIDNAGHGFGKSEMLGKRGGYHSGYSYQNYHGFMLLQG